MNPNYPNMNNYPYDPRQYPQVPSVPSHQIHGMNQHHHNMPTQYAPNPAYPGYNYGYGYPGAPAAYPPHQPAGAHPHHQTSAPVSAPTPKKETPIEQWVPNEDERSAIDAWFIEIDTNFQGFIGGAEAVQFFKRSNLPKDMLREVWSLADNHKTGKLDRTQFFFAIRMITILCSPIYAGSKPTIDLYNSSIHKRIPLPTQLYKKPEEEKKVVEEVKVVEPVQAAPTPVQPTQVQPAPSNLPLPTQVTQHHAPYPQPPVNAYGYGYAPNVPPAHPSGYGYAGYAQPHVPAPAAIPPAQTGYYNTGYAYPVQQVAAAPPAAAPAPQPAEDEEFSDFAGAASNPQNHPSTNNIPQPQFNHLQPVQNSGVSSISAPQRAQPPASLIDDDLLLLGPADIIEKTQSMSISSSIPDPLPNQAPLSNVNSVNAEEDDDFSDFTGAHSSSVPTHVPAPVTHSLATKSASPVPLFDESAPKKHQDRDLLQKALSTSNDDDDDFTSFTGSTVAANPTPLAPPTSTVVPLITSTAPSTVSTAPKLYDASKLSIFDDMVENDLMATKHEEDWEDFSGATSNSNQVPPQTHSTELPAHTLTSSTHLAGQLGPITVDIAAQSVNPFDDFDGFEASDTTQKLQPSTSDANDSNKDQDKEEEDFGDFETHAIPLQRADSIHRSDEVVDLPAYYQHSKHQRHESGSTRTFPSDEGVSSKFGSSVGSEISFKQGALFIEDTLHRSGEIVDFQAFQAPEPALIRRGSRASTHDANEEVEDEVVQGPINYHQQMNSRQSNNNLQMYDSGKTFISDASIVDIRSDIGCDSVSEYNSGKYIAGGDSSSEYNSGKFDLSRMNSTQSLARDILNDDNDEDAEEEYNKRNVPKSVGPSEKTVVKTLNKSEDDEEDDPFADLEIDETAQKEYALNNPLPVEEVSPSTNDKEMNRTSPLSLHISTTAPTSQPQTFDFGDDEDDIGEFQDFQSVPNSPMPSHSTNSHVASNAAPATSSNYDIADLLDFSSDVAPSTAPNSSSTIKPVSSVNDTFDLLSLDYVPAPSATLAPSNNFTSHTADPFDPFSAPTTAVKSEDIASFEPNFDNHKTQHKHQEEEFDPFTDYQSSAVTNNTDDDNDDDFTTFADHTSSSTPVAASVAPVQQTVTPSVAPVQEKKKEEKPIVMSATPSITTTTTSATIPISDKPLTLQNLEVLAVLLFEQNYYEAAYHCTIQSSTLRQLNDLSEQKKVALENDELEDAVLVKKQVKEITKLLVSSDIEQQWQRLVSSSSSSPSSTKPLSIQDYYQRLSKDKGITKVLLQKIQQTYYQPSLIPDKHSPLQDQLKYYLLTKHAIKIIDYLISQQSYDIYEKIYNELLQLCKSKIITIQQYIQQYQQIQKNVIQNEIKGHSFMQSFVLQSTVLLEHAIYLAVAAVELLFFERSVNNGSNKKKGTGNLALEVFDLSQEILVQMEDYFEVKSDVSRKTMDEIVLANATVSQNLPQEKVMHCHLIFRPLAKQIEGANVQRVVYSTYVKRINQLPYSLPLINLLKKEGKKELIDGLSKAKKPFLQKSGMGKEMEWIMNNIVEDSF